MAKAMAFFPWLIVDKPLEIGPIRLLPYEHGVKPGDQPGATQADVDAIMGAYANRPNHRLTKATILEVDDWRAGQDPEPTASRLFAAREALAFAALSERTLFGGHCGYCSFDTFTLVVQRYEAGRGDRFAYSTRRRDGIVSNFWSSKEFAFQRPLHVHESLSCSLDELLAAFVMDSAPDNVVQAVAEFNRANTDSTEVLPHVEMVMMKSAFEWLFAIDERADNFSAALDRCMLDLPPETGADGPLRERWKLARSKSPRPIHAWAREFCARRGAAAHGVRRGGDHFVWSEASHLAFASKLFPLVLKKFAADAGLYQLSRSDRERLRRADEYVLHDPMAFDEDEHEGYVLHPWEAIDHDIRMAEISRSARAALEAGLSEATGDK